jgi:predicted transcriptional regulator
MNGIVYDTSQVGLEAVLKVWQLKALHVLWSSPGGAKSFVVWEKVNKILEGETISRASIINFLEAMRETGVLSGEQETGKGGYHWVYSPAMDEAGFKQFIAKTLLEKLMKEFPAEMKEAIKTLNR